jgi:hypothetical protein
VTAPLEEEKEEEAEEDRPALEALPSSHRVRVCWEGGGGQTEATVVASLFCTKSLGPRGCSRERKRERGREGERERERGREREIFWREEVLALSLCQVHRGRKASQGRGAVKRRERTVRMGGESVGGGGEVGQRWRRDLERVLVRQRVS